MDILGEHIFKLRRLPIAGGLLASFSVLIAGVYWFVTANFYLADLFSSFSVFLELACVVLLILFGLGASLFFGLLVFDLQNALVVNDDGLQFKSSFFTIKPINWDIVEHIGLFNTQNRDVYVVHIEQPKDFINTHQGLLIRFFLKVNNEITGSPIAIVYGLLEVGDSNLLEVLNRYCDRYAS